MRKAMSASSSHEGSRELPGMENDVRVFGFWIYLMTDLVIFAALFAAFVVLRNHTFGGPSGQQLFQLSYALIETVILLTSSFTCALASYSMYRKCKAATIVWYLITFLLGVSFLVLEISEFSRLIKTGSGPDRSAFLSSYFALVGTHGAHISAGLLWMGVAIFRIGFRGLLAPTISRVLRLALFWHFLDVVWIFIFTVVYGMGHLG